jgi:hypothetical protein
METGVNMSETTTEDEEAHERRKRKALATAVAVSGLCMLGIVVVLRVWRFIDARARRHTDEP